MIFARFIPNHWDGRPGSHRLNVLTMRVLGRRASNDVGVVLPGRPSAPSPGAWGETRYVRLILIESGSDGLAAHAATADGEQTLALAQGDRELAAEYACRVIRRIRVLEQGRHTVERALLLLGPSFSAEATVARLLIARALITHSAVPPSEGAELVLSASSNGKRSELQRWLPGLVDALIGEPGSGAVTIAVKFGGLAPEPLAGTAG